MKISILVRSDSNGEPSVSHIVTVEKDYCLIGRKGCDVNLNDPKCSKHHAVIFQDLSGALRIRDLESTNGIFVKDQTVKVEEAPLSIGSKIRIGSANLTVISFRHTEIAKDPEKIPSKADRVANILKKDSMHVANKEVINSWPHKFQALPKDAQSKFVDFIDNKGTSSHILIKDLK